MDHDELYDILLQKLKEECDKEDANITLLNFYADKIENYKTDKSAFSNETSSESNDAILIPKPNNMKKRNLRLKANIVIVCSSIILFILSMNLLGYSTFGFNLFSIGSQFHKKESQALLTDERVYIWIPENFTINYIEAEKGNMGYVFAFKYENENEQQSFIFSIQIFDDMTNLSQWTENNGDAEEIIIDNQIYIIMSNYELNMITWNRENITYHMWSHESKKFLIDLIPTLPQGYK